MRILIVEDDPELLDTLHRLAGDVLHVDQLVELLVEQDPPRFGHLHRALLLPGRQHVLQHVAEVLHPFRGRPARRPPAWRGAIRAVLPADGELIDVADWAELHQALRSQPVDLMVLDPRAAGEDASGYDESEPSPLLTLLTEFRSVPAILYATHSRDGLRAVLPLARSGAHQVIFRGFDDTRERLRALLERLLQPLGRAVDHRVAGVAGRRLHSRILARLDQPCLDAELAKTQPFYGLEFEGRSFDCGSKVGFLTANIAYALARDDLAPAIRAEIKSLLG